MIRWLLLLFLLVGCTPQRPLEDRSPAGSSSLTKAQAVAIASAQGPWTYVAPTGSMAPVIDSGCVLMLEVYTGQKLFKGDILLHQPKDFNGTICHRAVEIGEDAVYISGDNNTWPDGWIQKSTLKYRVVGILFTQRS